MHSEGAEENILYEKDTQDVDNKPEEVIDGCTGVVSRPNNPREIRCGIQKRRKQQGLLETFLFCRERFTNVVVQRSTIV